VSLVAVRAFLRAPALLAVLSLLVMTTAGAAPGLFHGGDLDHCCEYCHLGHAPVLEPAPGLESPVPAQHFAEREEEVRYREAFTLLISEPSRAPPA